MRGRKKPGPKKRHRRGYQSYCRRVRRAVRECAAAHRRKDSAGEFIWLEVLWMEKPSEYFKDWATLYSALGAYQMEGCACLSPVSVMVSGCRPLESRIKRFRQMSLGRIREAVASESDPNYPAARTVLAKCVAELRGAASLNELGAVHLAEHGLELGPGDGRTLVAAELETHVLKLINAFDNLASVVDREEADDIAELQDASGDFRPWPWSNPLGLNLAVAASKITRYDHART
ncbi:MAG TPA: hypothetical protein VNM92_13800 [Thermoanaerobaculia bacterium]|nr:hypothetical protein [Thermoanaerobaculia bacterium]